jgi:UDP-glucose 4-epimerase
VNVPESAVMNAPRHANRILVTGGAGFIGSHLVEALMTRGDEPVVLDNFSTGDIANLPSGLEIVTADIASPEVVDQIVAARPTAVIHAAAQVSVPRSMEDPERDRAVNLLGTAHVIEGARRVSRCRLVFLSTGGGIYGETVTPATEESLPRPKSFYSVHKYAAERYVELSGLPYAIARLANVYGPRQRTDLEGGVVAIFAERLAQGEPLTIFGSGCQRRDFVHVSDVVTAVLAMLDADVDRIWNVGTEVATTLNELLTISERVIGPSVEVRREQPRAGDVFNSCLAIGRISTELGWAPRIPLIDGIKATWGSSSSSAATGRVRVDPEQPERHS